MQAWKGAIIVAAAVLPVMAGTIDVTGATEVTLATGNTLEFTISEYSFKTNAGAFGVASYPTHVTFELFSMPETGNGQFIADLESPDGSEMVAFPSPLTWQQGEFQGAGYTGPISALYGSLALPEAVSGELFSGGSAVLLLRNMGPAVTVGLPPYRIAQDFMASLSVPGFSTSAPVIRAVWDPPDRPAVAPEPGAGTLMAIGVALLCLAAAARKRISHRNIQ